jgi:hypothetical protein
MNQRKAIQQLRRLPHVADPQWPGILEAAERDYDVIEPGLHRFGQPQKFKLKEPNPKTGAGPSRPRSH